MDFISKLFIDGGDPQETVKANALLREKRPEWNRGIDGQTTNPTLVARNPDIQKYLAAGKKLTKDEILVEYKKIVEGVAVVTKGPISIQVIGDAHTPIEDFIAQARVYKEWIPNGVIKFPCTTNGLAAAEWFCAEFPVNITLNFSQEQAAAVYAATRGAKHTVFISPFVGRLDDRGENGMDVVVNELRMYSHAARDSVGALRDRETSEHTSHVQVLTASVRNLNHLLYAIKLASPAITIPFKVFQEWADGGFALPGDNFLYEMGGLSPISYREIPLNKPWQEYNIQHDLTDVGITNFLSDWNAMLK